MHRVRCPGSEGAVGRSGRALFDALHLEAECESAAFAGGGLEIELSAEEAGDLLGDGEAGTGYGPDVQQVTPADVDSVQQHGTCEA